MKEENTMERTLKTRVISPEEMEVMVTAICDKLKGWFWNIEITDVDWRTATAEGETEICGIEVGAGLMADVSAKAEAVFKYTPATYMDPEEFTYLDGGITLEDVTLWEAESGEDVEVPAMLWSKIEEKVSRIKEW